MPISSQFPDAHIVDKPIHELILQGIRDNVTTGRKALINSETNASFTYGEVHNLTYLMASNLHKEGLRKNDVIVICMPNRPEYALIFLATAMRGGITSGLNSVYTPDELERQFRDCKCKFVFTTESILPKVLEATKNLVHIEKIYVIHDNVASLKNRPKYSNNSLIVDFGSICEVANPNWQPIDLPKVDFYTKTDVVLLPYSSGTTGVPKGTMLSHYNMAAIMHIADNPAFFLRPGVGETSLGFLPFFHIYGFFILLLCLKNGIQIVTMPKFAPKTFLELIQTYKVKFLHVVPPILLFLAKNPMVIDYDVSSVEAIGVGAAPVGKDLSESVMERLPNLKYVIQGFGMTETSAVTHLTPPTPKEEIRHGSVGLLLPNYQCKVVDTETGKEVGMNQRGEICVKCVTIMLGYLNRPKDTAIAIDEEGYLHTGDIGYYDEEGFFYIVDRLKELIKVKGFQVPPAELEDLLLSHDDIQDAAVIGIKDLMSGEVPKAFIVRKDNAKITKTDVQNFIEKKVAPYKRLAGGVEFVSELPKSPSGKILRRILKEKERTKNHNSKL